MANVSYWSSAVMNDLLPGDADPWIMWGFNYGDVVYVSAHPVVGDPNAERILRIENLRIEGNVGGRRLMFDARNAGPDSIPGYILAYSWVSA